jgi:hypothetical protein
VGEDFEVEVALKPGWEVAPDAGVQAKRAAKLERRGWSPGPFRQGWHAQFEWKLADFWIGAFWKRCGNCIDLWICFLPCVPLHVSWWWSREPLS